MEVGWPSWLRRRAGAIEGRVGVLCPCHSEKPALPFQVRDPSPTHPHQQFPGNKLPLARSEALVGSRRPKPHP